MGFYNNQGFLKRFDYNLGFHKQAPFTIKVYRKRGFIIRVSNVHMCFCCLSLFCLITFQLWKFARSMLKVLSKQLDYVDAYIIMHKQKLEEIKIFIQYALEGPINYIDLLALKIRVLLFWWLKSSVQSNGSSKNSHFLC